MINEKEIFERGYVLYSDFGAVGDGVCDDFESIFASHEFANAHALPVRADEGKTFYIHHFDKSAIIKTDTDFTGARFILDDTGSDAFINRSVPLYLVERDNEAKIYEGDELIALFGNISFKSGDKKIDALEGKLDCLSLVRFTNANHRDFIRNGGNVNSGNPRTDCLLIDKDGSVSEDTPIAFDFDEVTKIEIYRTDDKPITVKGGYFETICCTVVKETEFENKWRGYYRKFKIQRPNTTMLDMTHRIHCEPYIPSFGYGRVDEGKLRQSYPYYGFLFFHSTYNSKAINCALNGHTTYYEDKKTSDKPVPQGTYDLVIEYSSHVTCEGITSFVDICDTRYWGIMSSNGAKNLNFINCSMSRFDAHRGFWNAKLINCEFGQNINVIGGGTLYIEGCKRLSGRNFIALRGDYGATFNGDIIIKDCVFVGKKSYRGARCEDYITDGIHIINSGFNHKSESYIGWDFGYTCYMPRSITIDNLKSDVLETTFVYNSLSNAPFEGDGRYVLTDSITFKNMAPLKICASEESQKLLSIPIKVD